MVVGAFPAAKLMALFLRQISKPIANYAKGSAKEHPFFRTYFCMPPAQFYNWCEIKTKMWVLNMGKPVNIPILNEAMAIELGANLLGEGIVFIIAASILLAEYSRQSRKEAAKERARCEEMEILTSNIHELYFQVEKQDAQIRELNRNLEHMESKVVKKPWTLANEDTPVEIEKIDNGMKSDSTSGRFQKLPYEQRNRSLVLQALNDIENDVLRNNENNDDSGLVFKGLDYLYYNSIIISSSFS